MEIVDEEQEDAARYVGARTARRQHDPFGRRRRRRRQHVGDAAAGDHRHRRDVLLHAVFEDLEFFLLQIGDEVALLVADDDVVRDEIDLHFERRSLLRREPCLARRCLTGRLRRQPGGQGHEGCSGPETVHFQTHKAELYILRARGGPSA